MISNHIRNEVLRRIQTADDLDHKLISALGINAAAQPIERAVPLELRNISVVDDDGEGEPIRGDIPFELAISALGEVARLDCRASYVVTLCDDEDRHTGEPIRILGNMTMRYELLDWSDPDQCDEETGEHDRKPVPQWIEANLFPLIPWAMERKLDDLIEEQAIAHEKRIRTEDEKSPS